jgi:hypothetical protein
MDTDRILLRYAVHAVDWVRHVDWHLAGGVCGFGCAGPIEGKKMVPGGGVALDGRLRDALSRESLLGSRHSGAGLTRSVCGFGTCGSHRGQTASGGRDFGMVRRAGRRKLAHNVAKLAN